jgi:acid phosphatase
MRIRPAVVLLLVAAVAITAVVAWAISEQREGESPLPVGTPLPAAAPFGSAAAGGQPIFGHAYLVVLENHGYDTVVEGSQMPYLKTLIARGALATKYDAVARPSQPNYIALFGGDTFGIDDDNNHDIAGDNVADQLEAKGRTWSVSAENYPGNCFRGATARGGRDGNGTYARKHNPAISFLSISGSPARCARIHDLAAFDPAEADFQMLIPNLCNDAHDCPLSTADQWLSRILPKILDSATFRKDGLLIVTFDEAESRQENHVPLVAVGPSIRAGTAYADDANHYSLLRTFEDNWGLGCLARACRSSNLGALFTPNESPPP